MAVVSAGAASAQGTTQRLAKTRRPATPGRGAPDVPATHLSPSRRTSAASTPASTRLRLGFGVGFGRSVGVVRVGVVRGAAASSAAAAARSAAAAGELCCWDPELLLAAARRRSGRGAARADRAGLGGRRRGGRWPGGERRRRGGRRRPSARRRAWPPRPSRAARPRGRAAPRRSHGRTSWEPPARRCPRPARSARRRATRRRPRRRARPPPARRTEARRRRRSAADGRPPQSSFGQVEASPPKDRTHLSLPHRRLPALDRPAGVLAEPAALGHVDLDLGPDAEPPLEGVAGASSGRRSAPCW